MISLANPHNYALFEWGMVAGGFAVVLVPLVAAGLVALAGSIRRRQ